jgi:hypothetical protein
VQLFCSALSFGQAAIRKPRTTSRRTAEGKTKTEMDVSRNLRAPTASLRDRLRRHLTEPVRRKTRRSEQQSENGILVAVENWLERLPVWQDAMLRACAAMASISIFGAILQLSGYRVPAWFWFGYAVPYTILLTSAGMWRRHRHARRRMEQARWES